MVSVEKALQSRYTQECIKMGDLSKSVQLQ